MATEKPKIRYLVIDDCGDEWETGDIAHSAKSRKKAFEWAEIENYHSASIVREENGERVQKLS
jgi:hypothetical protein